jgi:hypothetical protein
MDMKKVLMLLLVVAFTFSVVPLSSGKEKTKKAKDTASAPSPAPSSGKAGWKEVRTGSPDLVKVAYKFDGSYILLQCKNLSKDKTVRIKYQAKWKKNENGKWADDASAEGLTVRLKALEELTKEVRTHSKDIKDVIFDIEASVV